MSTAPAITTRGLTLRYSGAERRALDDISFDVFTGEILGILGATGAGKSTLLQVLAGVIPHHEHDAAFRGEVNILGRDIDDYGSLTAIAAEVGLVLQDPEVQLVNTVVREELAWGMENRGVPIPEMQQRLDRAAELFDITPLLDRFTHALSGGEKQRVVVAAVYCLNPRIILLDEPTSELDPAGTESVMKAVRTLADEGVTVVIVDHKIEELALYADRLMVLDSGSVRAVGTPREILTRGDSPYRPQVVDVALELDMMNLWPGTQLPLGVDEAVATWTGAPAPAEVQR